ncbi:hypothetical protein [Massilia sp. METH4]|uniref:hypothetical protein n=1 Tax=Massilia sp. METH4 TaxID=3123041 RepID=UPI0030CDD31B
MQSDPQESAGDYAGNSAPEPALGAPTLSPRASRKLALAGGVLLLVAIGVAGAWAVSAWRTDRAMASVESSIAGQGLTLPAGGARSAAPGATSPPTGPASAEETVRASPPATDRLPPLVLPGQPVPAAVLRDLPEWVTAEVAPSQGSRAARTQESAVLPATPPAATAVTSGASGDESAVPREQPAPRRRTEAPARANGYGAIFARCPGPGQSGAVECRRAVCDGAARKAAACAPYLK